MDFPTLRRAARLLTPASLLLTPAQPRRQTFVSDARRRRGELLLTLSPIAGPPMVNDAAVLDFRLDGRDLAAHGLVVEHRDREAIMAVRREVEVRPPRRGRICPPPGTLVAVFVPEGAGLGRCCQPVLDIGLRALRIASSYPFAPGVHLRGLVVLAGHEVVRQVEGTVLHVTPIVQVDGTMSYHCAVRLRRATTVPAPDDPAAVVEITEPTRVRTILWGLCDLAHQVTLQAGAAAVAGQLTPVRGSRDALPEMRCLLERDLPLTGPVQVECTLFGSGYRFFARVRQREGRTLHLAPAPVVREWHRRDEERLTLPAGADATVTFRHPLDGRRYERPLLDVSVQGFGFPLRDSEDALWPGLPLEHVTVRLWGRAVRPGRATVRTTGEQRCGVQMEHTTTRDADRLRFELMNHAARPIEFHDGEDLGAILDLHQTARLLEPDMIRNLDHMCEETRRTWRLAHQHPDGLMRTAVVPWKGGLGASATLVRAYDRSWVFQHLAVASSAVPASPGQLHSALVRLVVSRPDCASFFTFADAEARSVHTVLRAFISEWSTPEHRGATPMVLYAGDASSEPGPLPGTRRLRPSEDGLVESAAARLLHPVCARALGLRAGEIEARATGAAWRRGGLARGREAWGAFDRGRLTAVLLREWASPGLSLSSLLSAALYLPVRPEADGPVVTNLLRLALSGAVPGNPPTRFVFAPEACSSTPLLGAGLRRVAGCTLYGFASVGMREYHRYVATRYGFLHGRLRARSTGAP